MDHLIFIETCQTILCRWILAGGTQGRQYEFFLRRFPTPINGFVKARLNVRCRGHERISLKVSLDRLSHVIWRLSINQSDCTDVQAQKEQTEQNK